MDVAMFVVRLQVFEKVCKYVRVPLVKNPVRLFEHKVEVSFRIEEKLRKEFWNKRSTINNVKCEFNEDLI